MAQKKGCCFFGCIGAVLVFVVAIVALGLGARWGFKKLLAWTDTAPMTLAAPELPPSEFVSLTNRVAQFLEGISREAGPQQIVLSPAEINVLLTNLPADNMLSSNFRVSIVSNALQTSAAIPLDAVPGPFQGRYLNMQARLNPSIEGGRLALRIADIRIRGQEPPGEITAEIQKQNLLKDIGTNSQVSRVISNLESVTVTNGALVIISK